MLVVVQMNSNRAWILPPFTFIAFRRVLICLKTFQQRRSIMSAFFQPPQNNNNVTASGNAPAGGGIFGNQSGGTTGGGTGTTSTFGQPSNPASECVSIENLFRSSDVAMVVYLVQLVVDCSGVVMEEASKAGEGLEEEILPKLLRRELGGVSSVEVVTPEVFLAAGMLLQPRTRMLCWLEDHQPRTHFLAEALTLVELRVLLEILLQQSRVTKGPPPLPNLQCPTVCPSSVTSHPISLWHFQSSLIQPAPP
jgi:hypothetical protein